MKLTFLEAAVPLTKRYEKGAGGTLVKTPYPFVWEFTSHEVVAPDLAAMHRELITHAALGHCLLKGSVSRPLVQESRAGSTDSNGLTDYIVLDLDGLPDVFTWVDDQEIEHKVNVTLDVFLKAIGLDDYSHIIQWSASYGIENARLRAHLFFAIAKHMTAPLLKQWLIQLNHEVAMLRAAMGLTKTGNSISWALDISACQNDKLIYIAPPILKGIKDPMAKQPRIELVKRKHDALTLAAVINSSAKNKELTHKRLEQLREKHGLPKRKTQYKMHGAVEVMVKPDACTITEMKQERGFVYFNLNGGDSWAYYHPETNPDYIFNFKGEPAYLTKELLPDYWEQLTQQGSRANSTGQTFLAFCDRATGTYWRGTFDATTDSLDLFVAKNETQVRHFAKQNGLPLGDFIPEWDLVFDPHDSVRVDHQNRTINQFALSEFMKAQSRQVTTIPKTISKVIDHVLGNDPAITDHFLNWIACILQFRDRTKTAWIWHGTQGTGKGILFTKILRPIFGKGQTTAQNMESLNEPYNHWMRQSFLVFVDEVQTKALDNERGVLARLKNYITEEMVPIRAMYQGVQECRNYTNWILASNKADPAQIDKEDRRMNVAKYQPNKLTITDKEIEQIDKELQAFHDFLLYYPADRAVAGTVLNTSDRQTMISISESAVDTVGSAIIDGTFSFLMDQLPASTTAVMQSGLEFNKIENYKQVLLALLNRTDRNTGACNITRDELLVLFNYVVGNMPTSPNKFTSLLKHHRIHISQVWINSGTQGSKERGIRTTWKDLAGWQGYLDVLNPPSTKKPATVTSITTTGATPKKPSMLKSV
jgi:hypothetical protein